MAPLPAGVPWPLAVSAGAAVMLVAVVALVPPGPGVPVFVLHIAEVLLAGAAAYAVDDAAAPLADVTPRPLWRRRLPGLIVSAALIATAAGVIALVLRGQQSLPGMGDLAVEVAVLWLVAVAAASLVARHGEPEPGVMVAPVVALVGLAALIAGPLLHTSLFLTDDGRTLLRPWWVATGVVALAAIAVASRDPASRSTSRSASLWVRSPRRRSTDSGSA